MGCHRYAILDALMTASASSRLASLARELDGYAGWLQRGQSGRSRETMFEQGALLWAQLQREATRCRGAAGVDEAMIRGGAAWRTIQQEAGQLALF
jgi:hypothetical protein